MPVTDAIDIVKGFQPNELEEFGSELSKLPEENTSNVVKSLLDKMNPKAKTKAVTEAAGKLSEDDTSDVMKSLLDKMTPEAKTKAVTEAAGKLSEDDTSDVMKSLLDKMNPKAKTKAVTEAASKLSEDDTSDVMKSLLDKMTPKAKTKAVTETVAKLPEKEKKEVVKEVVKSSTSMIPPDVETRNKLWKIAVWAFAIVMVGAFLFIAVGIFRESPEDPIASGDLLLSIFTASVGFFAGLFAPTPTKQGDS